MKAITVKIKPEEMGTLLQKVRTSQELGFNNIDLALSVKMNVGELISQIHAAGSKVQSLRLCAPSGSTEKKREPAFNRLNSCDETIRLASIELVASTCQGLAGSGVNTVVLDGGDVEVVDGHEVWVALEAALEAGSESLEESVTEALKKREAHVSRSLDALCRSLFELSRRCDGLRFAILTPSSPLALCLPQEMEHVLNDLPASLLGYWHSTSAARCLEKLGVVDEEQWLDRFGPRMFGVYLSDSVGAQGEQAPGLGEVNFKRVKPYLATNMARVLTIDDDCSSSKLRFGSDYLCEVGIF